MNIRQLIDKLLDRWPAKIICLMLATFLYIFHQVSLVDKKVYVIPLEIKQEGNVMLVGECPASVSVIVRAQSEVINTVINTDLHASINLNSYAKTGTYTVPVSVTIDDKLLTYDPLEIRVKPENLIIAVESKATKFVNLTPSLSGTVGDGYMISDVSMDPSAVQITGPKSIIDEINEIPTTELIVSNAMTNFSNEVDYLEINKLIEVENKGPYKATVSVIPQPMSKDYNGIHIVARGLLDTLEIETEIPDIDFTISGTVPILSKYILGTTAVQIDLSQITEPGLYNLPVKFQLPMNFVLEKKSFESVSVNVIERKEPLNQNQTQVQDQNQTQMPVQTKADEMIP